MKRKDNDYNYLRCPYCHDTLTSVNTYTLACGCDNYPVVENIAVLKKYPDKRHHTALTLLSHKNKKRALLILLDGKRVANYLVTFVPFLNVRVLLIILTFIYPSSKDWWQYLIYRDTRVTNVLALATVGSIVNNSHVVDIGCGTGNFLKQAHAWKPNAKYIGIDISFFLLFIARILIPKNIVLVCADVNSGVPVKDEAADYVFVNDCFMYLRQTPILMELNRIVSKQGEAYLTHVHNSEHRNLGQGSGVSPHKLQLLNYKLFTVTCLSDKQLYSQIRNGGFIQYGPVPKNGSFRSYSYRLARTAAPPILRPLPLLQKQYPHSAIDYSEDEQLRPTSAI